jgi:UDP-GlcNAc3NAcA epimerase
MPMNIVTIIGARPQFIKAAVVSRNIHLHNLETSPENQIVEYIVHTGQHYDSNMSDVFFEEMDIPRPDVFLGIHQLSHGAMTGRMLEEIEKVLLLKKPDAVLVYGDTNSTLAGALAAVKLQIPVAHVEAGLRSFNRMMPEEHNRVLTDHVSNLLFCPTQTAVRNLENEGIKSKSDQPYRYPQIHLVGDVMYDAALFYAKQANIKATVAQKIITDTLHGKPFALFTLHRAENTDSVETLTSIVGAIESLSEKMPVVWPVHPRTLSKIKEFNISISKKNVFQIPPVGYFDMIALLDHCRIVLTDSGGLQKEAFFFKKNCITLRKETEWIELVEHGFNKISGTESKDISLSFQRMMEQKPDFGLNLYGNGNAGNYIVCILAGKNIKE